MEKQYLSKIRFREDTAKNWQLANPILNSSEPGREIDTGIFKIGDGKTPWNELRAMNESIKTINEPKADGKLYVRSKEVDAITGKWVELPVQEAPNDGQLYLRNGETGQWVIDPLKANKVILENGDQLDLVDVYNLLLPEKTKLNINDLLLEDYNKEIDMHYSIKNYDGSEDKVYAIRVYEEITEHLNQPHELVIHSSNIKSVVGFGGTIGISKQKEIIKAIPCNEVEVVVSSKKLLVVSTVPNSERVLAPIDIWVLYTKENN